MVNNEWRAFGNDIQLILARNSIEFLHLLGLNLLEFDVMLIARHEQEGLRTERKDRIPDS
jgi:hypothetical protein